MKRLSFFPATTTDNSGERVPMTHAIPFSDSVMARVLAAGAAESITVPSGAKVAVFSANCDFFAKNDGVAAAPAADVTDGSASTLNPVARQVSGVSTISVIAPLGGIVTAEFFS